MSKARRLRGFALIYRTEASLCILRTNTPQAEVSHLVSLRAQYLGPCYIQMLAEIIEKHNISYHFYADDTQIYLSFRPSDKAEPDLSRSRIELCVQDINRWMTANKLKLNNDKTDLLVFTARHRPQPMLKSIYAGTDLVNASDSARNIGVCFDNLITMEKQIILICKSCVLSFA